MPSGRDESNGPSGSGTARLSLLLERMWGGPMAAAWIGFAGGVLATVISAFVALRQSDMAQKLALLTRKLDDEAKAKEILDRYREPLASAAFDLQSRLYNILRMEFLILYGEGKPRADEAIRTTVFRMAQYFGWTEILRRDIQYLSFQNDEVTIAVAKLQAKISYEFLKHEVGAEKLAPELMIWTEEQRAIGERMIVEDNGKLRCMGYATFSDHCDDLFAPWCDRLRAELNSEAAQARMRAVQHKLCDLVRLLDEEHVRFSEEFLKPA